MCFPLKQTSKTISTQNLQQTYKYVSIKLADELRTVNRFTQMVLCFVHVIFQQTVFPVIAQVGLCLPKQRSNIILQRTLHASLVIYKMRVFVINNNIAALKVAKHKILMLNIG